MLKTLVPLVLVMGTVFAETPVEAFDSLVNDFYSGNGQGVYDALSTESAGMMEMLLLMVKSDPEAAAEEIGSEFDIDISPDDISKWTSVDLMNTLLNSPGFLQAFPPREEITVTGSTIHGDSCTVSFTMPDMPGEIDLLMVKQNGSWKLDKSVLEAEL